MKKAVIALAVAAVTLPAVAADTYTIDSRHTYPVFEVNHLGFSTQRGRFNKTSGKVVLDLAAKSGSVELTIDAASLDMGADDWNKHMKSDDFFNVEKYPAMTFKSDKLIFEGDKPVAAEGSFTLLGVSRPLRVAVANFRCAPHPMNKKPTCGADISATLTRSEFGMSKYVPAVGDQVKISVPVEATKD